MTWPEVALQDIAAIVGGGTPERSNSAYYGGGIPWVTPKDMKTWSICSSEVTLTSDGVRSSATRVVPEGSVLVVVRSGVLKHTLPVGVARLPVAINQDMKALLVRGDVHPDYVAHLLKASSDKVLSHVRGTTADNFPLEILRRLTIPLPPVEEQRRIASILDKAEVLRAKRREAIARLDTLAQSIFIEMFGEPSINKKQWETVQLGEVAVEGFQNGLYKPASEYGEGTPILRIDAFYDGRVTDVTTLRRVKVSPKEEDAYGIHEDDIVINRVNSIEYLGKSALIPRLSEPTIFESNMMRLRVDATKIIPQFLIAYLQSSFIKRQIKTASKDAVNQSSINQKDVAAFVLMLPPLPLQVEFTSRVGKVQQSLEVHQAALAQSDSLFASLQHRAFRGEL